MAATGAAAFAMLSQQSHWADTSPGNVGLYATAVTNAVTYLLNNATLSTVSTRNDGVNICPGGSASCNGIYWGAGTGEETYTTGLVTPALVEYATRLGGGSGAVATATTGPLVGRTWGQIAQMINNEWASGQNTASNGVFNGGWRYFPGQGGGGAGTSDMSTTQWAVISFLYNGELGATVPAAIKTNLAAWLQTAQPAFAEADAMDL